MGRSPCCCHEAGVKKGPWTEEEDRALVEHIQKHGGHVGSWRGLPKAAGLNRCGKSCRLRWTNYLRPDIKRGNFSDDEVQLIIRLHAHLGNKWSTIATHLEGRTDNEIKNHWNTHIRKKLIRMGIDPVTHQRCPPPHVDGLFHLPEALLTAAASLGGLDNTLRQVQVLQHLLHAVTTSSSNLDSSSNATLMANLAAATTTTNAMTMLNNSSCSIDPINLFREMNVDSVLAHANYQIPPGYLRDYSSPVLSEQDHMAVQVQQLIMNTTPTASAAAAAAAAPVHGSYADTAPLVSATCAVHEVATAIAADHRPPPVQEFASFEPLEQLPSLCSLESDGDDPFWKDILESSFRF